MWQQQELNDKNERVRAREKGCVEDGLKRGRGLERCGVFRKCKCQVNSSSEQPFSARARWLSTFIIRA